MPIDERRVKIRLDIRTDQMQARETLMMKLRAKIQAGYLPATSAELADVLHLVTEYGKHVGRAEECKEILEKLSEEKLMVMEKLGVQCQGDHSPSKDYMVKTASDFVCRHCGSKFADLQIHDEVAMKAKLGGPTQDMKGAVEKMLNIE